MTDISVIIRCRNEDRYLAHVLRAVRAQDVAAQIEVLVVDNQSNDRSRHIACELADDVLDCDEYRPGTALNLGIAAASGSRIAVLSAHALPSDRSWLRTLTTAGRGVPRHLGTYGAQLYQIEAAFLDKRDLDIFSSAQRRFEQRDSDFWNANSSLARSDWDALAFDEQVIELEDHHWTKQHFARAERTVVFEPDALVYHYGHESRNDRQFLPTSALTSSERIDAAIDCLASWPASWHAVMNAGMTIGSLWQDPASRRAVGMLAEYLKRHWDFDVRWRMAGALGRIDTPLSVDPLLHGLSDPSFYVRDESAWALARLDTTATKALVDAVGTLPEWALPFAGLALSLMSNEGARAHGMSLLEECLRRGAPELRHDAVYFLGEVPRAVRDDIVVRDLRIALRDNHQGVQRGALWSWGKLATRDAAAGDTVQDVIEIARMATSRFVRAEAVVALGRVASRTGEPTCRSAILERLQEDEAGVVRYCAAQTARYAAASGDGQLARDALERCHPDDPDFGVRFERDLLTDALRRG